MEDALDPGIDGASTFSKVSAERSIASATTCAPNLAESSVLGIALFFSSAAKS